MMNNKLVPQYAFLISGVGHHQDKLQAFDQALLNAGPLAHNLVSVSSIIPARCKLVSPEDGFAMLIPGQITFCVMARQETNQPGVTASAAIGLVKSKDQNKFGYISEYHGDASSGEKAEKIAKRLAVEMFVRKIGIKENELDAEFTKAIAASISQKGNGWVSAVAMCIFVL